MNRSRFREFLLVEELHLLLANGNRITYQVLAEKSASVAIPASFSLSTFGPLDNEQSS